jgi:hypothetical protein
VRPPHRRARFVLLAAVAAVAAGGCGNPEAPPGERPAQTTVAVVGTPRPAADPSAAADAATFGPWRRRPVAPSSGVAAAAEDACRAQAAVGDLPLTLTDNRGDRVLTLVFTDATHAAVCHAAVTPARDATADARSLPEVVAGAAPAEGRLGAYDIEVIEARSGPRVVIVGRVSDVPEVSVSFDDATWGRMSMNAGWYTAWWPQAALAMTVATVDRRNTVISSFPVP